VIICRCDHVYDNACDAICNLCGDEREVAGHHYVNDICTVCNAKRDFGMGFIPL